MRIFLATIVFLSIFSGSFAIEFGFKLARNKMECFSDPLNPDTLVKFAVRADDPNYQDLETKIFDDEGVFLTSEVMKGQISKYTLTTKKEGNLHICVTNVGVGFPKVILEFSTGIEAGDMTNAASDKDLQPIDKQLQRLERLMGSVKKTTSFIVSKEDVKISEADSVPGKLYTYSFITIGVMVLVSFVQIKYLKNFFKNKKLI
jgi:hypothetical protein